MNSILVFFLNAFIIFIVSKFYLKGYKYIPKDLKTKKIETSKNITQKNNTLNVTYDYSSPIYLNQNLTCQSLGVHTWALLHSVAATYSNRPSQEEKQQFKDFFDGVMYFYPSKSKLMKEILEKHPLEYSNREELVYYMCEIHNEINKLLGKRKFNCRQAFDIWGGDCGCNE